MFKTSDAFFALAMESIEHLNVWAIKYKPNAIADHICYKCNSSEEFDYLRKLFETNCSFIYQSIISSRRIAIIKFLQPIKSLLGDISFLELSDQKPDGSQISGFDHIEIYPIRGTMEELSNHLEQKGAQVEKIIRPHHTTFDLTIYGSFKVRIEPEPLIQKIVRDEIKNGA